MVHNRLSRPLRLPLSISELRGFVHIWIKSAHTTISLVTNSAGRSADHASITDPTGISADLLSGIDRS